MSVDMVAVKASTYVAFRAICKLLKQSTQQFLIIETLAFCCYRFITTVLLIILNMYSFKEFATHTVA